MPKPKNHTATDQDDQSTTPPTTDPSTTNETNPSEEPFPTFKIRSYEALMNQIPRFSVDVDMSEDTTEMGIDENLDNYEFSSDEESLATEEKLVRQSKRLTKGARDSNRVFERLSVGGVSSERLSVGGVSNDSNELMPSPRIRHGGLILKKENAVLVNNLKEKMDILKRLIKRESDYLFELDLLREKFIGTLKRSNLISAEEMEKLFCYSQLNIIWNVNSELLNQFENFYTTLEHINEQSTIVSPRASTIGQIFMRLTPFVKNYIQYSNQLDTCYIAINNKRLKDSNFKSIVKKLERMCSKLASAEQMDGSFILLQAMKIPLQQFVHYKKALLDLLNISQSYSDECTILNDSLKLIEAVNHTFDQVLNEMSNKEKFYELNKKILKQSESGEIVTIIKPNRVFVNEAEVYMTSSENNYLEIRKKKKKKKDNHSNAISVAKLDIPNEKFFQDEKKKLVAFHFNDSIMVCTSSFDAPKPSSNTNKETAAKRKRMKQVASMIDSKKLRFKENIDLESDPVPWIRNIISPDPPTVSTYDQSGQETVSKSTTDLSHMFQLITWSRIYTFKFMDEFTKISWMQAIQQSLTEIKVSRKQDLDYPHAKSGGYLEIPQSWVLPSILTIQSYIRSYLVVQRTLRIKKKSRKGNRARLSVIHRINQQDNKLLQNQTFAQSYPKKETITLLKDYEEDVNDTYIVVDEEEEHAKPKERKNVEVEKVTHVETQPEITPAMEEVEISVHPIQNSTTILEDMQLSPIEPIPQPVQVVERVEPVKHEIVEQVIEEEEELEEEPVTTSPEFKKEMVDEIIYEDENGAQFYVRVGDEIVYEDEDGNQIVEIVTQEKFNEIVNAADLMEEEEEMEMAQRLTESQQEIVETINKIDHNLVDNKKEISTIQQNPPLEPVESVKQVEDPPVSETPIPAVSETQIVTTPKNEEYSIIEEPSIPNIQQSVSEPEKQLVPTVPTTQPPILLETKQDSATPVKPEVITTPPQETTQKTNLSTQQVEIVKSSPPLENSTTAATSNTTTKNVKPIIPTLDTSRKPEISSPTIVEQQPTSNLTTPRRSIASIDSPRKKEEEIAPWQKELLNKYKNDGKFKFVTQTAEEKIAINQLRASFSDEHYENEPINNLMTPRSSAAMELANSAIDPVTAKNLNRQSIRISSDFQNFLKKFKTIEQKANEDK